MPYTLTSLGHYVAQHRARRSFTVSTTLIKPDPTAPQAAVNRWTQSLQGTHQQLHEEGKRAVALITDAQVVAVVPFDWVSRLPLRRPPTLAPEPPEAETLFTQPAPEQPELVPRKQYRSNSLITPESLRRIYDEERARLAWWETAFPGYPVDTYEHRLELTSELVQMNHGYSFGHRLVRKVQTNVHAHPWATQHGRAFYANTDPLWVPEDIFQLFAQDRSDFNAHYVLLSMNTNRMLAVVERQSRLILGIVNTDSQARMKMGLA